MTDLPRGTVTLLFTDIEGSTQLQHRLGERYQDVVREHRRLLEAAHKLDGRTILDAPGANDARFNRPRYNRAIARIGRPRPRS